MPTSQLSFSWDLAPRHSGARAVTAPWRSHCGRGCASATPIRRCCLARTKSSGCAPPRFAPHESPRPLAATAPLGARGHPPANTDATRLSDPFPPGVSTRSGSSPRACSRARRRRSTRSASSTRHARAWRRTAPSSGPARDPTRATRTTCACACAEKTKKTKKTRRRGRRDDATPTRPTTLKKKHTKQRLWWRFRARVPPRERRRSEETRRRRVSARAPSRLRARSRRLARRQLILLDTEAFGRGE